MPRPAPSRTDAKSRLIRDAARHLFLQRGFLATTTDEIAASASVSKATLYVRYRRKEDLLADVLEDLIREGRPSSPPPPPSSIQELQDTLGVLVRSTLTQLMQPEYLALVRVLIAEMGTQPELGELFVQSVPRPLLERAATFLRAAQGAGLVQLVDPMLAARALIGPLLTYVLLDGLLARSPRVPDDLQLFGLVELFLRGVLYPPRSSP